MRELQALKEKLDFAQRQRIDRESSDAALRLKAARDEIDRARSALHTSRERWASVLDGTRDEVAILSLLELELGKKIAAARDALQGVGRGNVRRLVSSLERTCEVPSPARAKEARGENDAEAALLLRMKHIAEKQRVGAYGGGNSTARSLPSAVALPSPSQPPKTADAAGMSGLLPPGKKACVASMSVETNGSRQAHANLHV